MKIRRAIRTKLVEKLPCQYRIFVERLYYTYFVRNYLKKEIEIIRQLCNPYKVSLDIGANIGDLTLFLCKFSSYVYCFEPHPSLCEHLTQRFQGFNVSVENYALGNVNEELYLNIPSTKDRKFESRSSLVTDFENEYILRERVTDVERSKVRVRRLDDLYICNVGFVKIDVEGFEFEVLKGSEDTIRRERPNMFIEIEQRHHKEGSIYDIFRYVVNLGFFGYFVKDKKLRRIEEFDVERMQNESNEKGDAYVNNFLFSPFAIENLKL